MVATVMTKPSDNPADPFEKAFAEATKTMADDLGLMVSFSVDPLGVASKPSAPESGASPCISV